MGKINEIDLRDVLINAFKYINKKEIHVNELATYVKNFVSDYSNMDIEDVRKKVCAKLSADVKLISREPTFTKVKNKKNGYKKGVYSLRVIKEKPNPIEPDKKMKNVIKGGGNDNTLFDYKTNDVNNKNECKQNDFEHKLNVFNGLSTAQIGKGGEFATVSELLFRGFNATSMTVDDGVDIAAAREKEGKFFFIQVKTTSCVEDAFQVNIDKNSYARYNVSNMYYIIVIRFVKDNEFQNKYLIFNSFDIEKMVSRDLVGDSQKYYSMRFKMWNGGIHIIRQGKSDDVTFHLNNWGWIK